jgi:hypothetical protein
MALAFISQQAAIVIALVFSPKTRPESRVEGMVDLNFKDWHSLIGRLASIRFY